MGYLEEFLKQKTAPQESNMSMEPVKAIPPMSEKLKFAEANSEQVDEPTVSNIVNTYHPAAVGQQRMEAANAVMEQQRQPSNDRYAEAVQSSTITTPPPMSAMQEYQGFLEKNNPQPTWTDAAMGLIPIGIDALMGGHGGGLKVAADYYGGKLADKKKGDLTLQERLAAMQKSKYEQSLKTAKTDSKLYQAQDENGNDVWMTREQAIGSGLIQKDAKGSDRGDIAAAGRQQALMLANRKEIINAGTRMTRDKQFDMARNRRNTSKFAANLLRNANPVSDAGIGLLFQKGIFADVGNATAQEQAKYIGPPSVENKFERIKGQALRGEVFSTEDRKYLLKLADHIAKRSEKDVHAIGGQYTRGLQSVGLDASGIINPLLEATPEELSAMEESIYEVPTKTAPRNRAMTPAQNSSIMSKPTPEDAEYLKWRKSKYGQ